LDGAVSPPETPGPDFPAISRTRRRSEVARLNTEGTSRKVRLTEEVIKAAKPLPPARPGDRPRKVLLLDSTQIGFGVAVNGASKSYLVIRRVHGKQTRFAFRRVGHGSLAEARRAAEKLLTAMGDGTNPVEQKRANRAAASTQKAWGLTLGGAWELREQYLRAKKRAPRTIETERYLLSKYLGDWMNRELTSLTREDVRRKHASIASGIAHGRFKTDEWRRRKAGDGAATANNTMRCLRACWNRAARQLPELGISPTANIDWNEVAPRKSPIGLDGLADLWTRIRAIENDARRDLWTVLLYTGLRKTSAIEMRWADVDLEGRKLHIPTPKGGAKRAFDLPLPGVLVDLLRARREAHDQLCARAAYRRMRPWVFPADSASGHLVELREGEIGINPHDARRLFITAAEATDVSPYTIKLLANHALPSADVTASYMSIDVERLREPMEAIAAKLTALSTPPPGGNVLQMPARKAQSARR
jgi:integrase